MEYFPQPNSTSSTATTTTPSIHSLTMDSFVFDEYNKRVNQVSRLVLESRFLEAIRKLVEYGNREFLRSFQLRSEIKQGNNGNNGNRNSNNNNNDIITTDTASLIPPFDYKVFGSQLLTSANHPMPSYQP